MNKNEEYWKFAESEKHFNEIQAGIRNLASGWMLAAFAAIALLLKTDKNVTWLLSPAILVGIVSFMATLGLLILWINDQLVYERLLNSVFLVALKKESDDSELPPVRCMMLYATSGKGMSRWMALFYTIPMVAFSAITAAAALMRGSWVNSSDGVDSDLVLKILLVLCGIQLMATSWVQVQARRVPARTRAEAFNKAEFTALFKDKPAKRRACLADVIKRHKPAEPVAAARAP